MGRELAEGATGGASDGNFTAALGVPTIDGMGALGDGPHALHEHVVIKELAPRAALVAGLIARICDNGDMRSTSRGCNEWSENGTVARPDERAAHRWLARRRPERAR